MAKIGKLRLRNRGLQFVLAQRSMCMAIQAAIKPLLACMPTPEVSGMALHSLFPVVYPQPFDLVVAPRPSSLM